MSLNLVSPGVKVREVDLTIGRIDNINDQVGAIAGPFERGPVDVPLLIETENDLTQTFGKPLSTDSQYEYWMSASSYLSYGGILRVIRSAHPDLSNANVALAGGSLANLQINSSEDYTNNHLEDINWTYASRNPGSWANDLKVCTIDSAADQRLAIGTDGLNVGYAITAGFTTSVALSNGTVGIETGYLKGVITSVNTNSIDVKILSQHNVVTDKWSETDYQEGSSTRSFLGYDPGQEAFASGINTANFNNRNLYRIFDNVGDQVSIERTRFQATVGIGSTMIGFGADLDNTKIAFGDKVKSINGNYEGTVIGFTTEGDSTTAVIMDVAASVSFANTDFIVKTGIGSGLTLRQGNTAEDWYNTQTLGLENQTIFWKSLAEKPSTSSYASERSSRFDEMHVVVVDDTGKVTGSAGNIVEKWIGLSKASDAKISPSADIFYKNYIAQYSQNLFVGAAQTGTSLKFSMLSGYTLDASGTWGQLSQGVTFNGAGAKTFSLGGGNDYGGVGVYKCNLSDVISSYTILENPAEYSINYVIQGPSSGDTVFEAQAKANKLIQIANTRKDCIACISPYKPDVVGISDSDIQTNNIINFYDSLSSSSYAVFDSGYKYTFDRFNNAFRYVPLNGDTAGLMARTSINSFPWFSPAGSQRGSINNAVKLAYNPSQAQRDLLYPKRINPVVFSPGAGMILYGDKTALKEASAFDRINVRRLFLTIEQTIERAARAQLFEFNDILTRTNFLNIVEPYLRDVKAKRGIVDFVVICDDSNNTPDVVDSNQFKADIFVKPNRSINFIGLTFVATRSGVSFDEVVGNV
tara:strand:- start:5303 stop:7732 length:2430 start_codon:yes stop_codon:yes gene_type:complete